jgi:hypothetical protein
MEQLIVRNVLTTWCGMYFLILAVTGLAQLKDVLTGGSKI